MSVLARFELGEGTGAVELDGDAVGSLTPGAAPQSPWSLVEEPDWQAVEVVRLLAAAFDDGSIAALVAVRPARADGHDAERMAALMVDPKGRVGEVEQALLSTELDAEGKVRRVGVELWPTEEPPPHRLAADRVSHATDRAETLASETALMDARIDGEKGTAIFAVLRGL